MKTRDENGRFLPGVKSTGRGKGTSNKEFQKVRDKFQQLVDGYSVEDMQTDLALLEPIDRLKIMSGLLDFFIPKLNRTDHTIEGANDTIIIMPKIMMNDSRLLEPEPLQPSLPATTE